MPTVPGASIHSQALSGFTRSVNRAILPTVQRLQGLVSSASIMRVRSADEQLIPVVPVPLQRELLNEAGNILQRFFVGPDLRNPFAQDGVTPLAEYPRVLNFWIVWASVQVAEKHNAYIRKRLTAHPDILRWLEQARFPTTEQFDPTHTWQDRRGYQLSDRIWDSSIQSRVKLDMLLLDAFRTGRSSIDLAKDLEPFLLPGSQGLTTTKPYGRRANFAAMRLGRTEITRWFSIMTFDAAAANPFVDGIDWALSAQHPKVDICDLLATIGMKGQRLRDPYPMDKKVPLPVLDSHPLCICNVRPSAGRPLADVIDDYRDQMRRRLAPPLTPVVPTEFVISLIGPVLLRLFREDREEQQHAVNA